jgi:hypothetical protein
MRKLRKSSDKPTHKELVIPKTAADTSFDSFFEYYAAHGILTYRGQDFFEAV